MFYTTSKKNTVPLQGDKMAKGMSEIPQGTTFRGEVRFSSTLLVQGSIEGTVQGMGKLVVGGSLHGDVQTTEVNIQGKLQGTVANAKLIHLEQNALVIADLECQQLQVDKGATHNGTTVMRNE